MEKRKFRYGDKVQIIAREDFNRDPSNTWFNKDMLKYASMTARITGFSNWHGTTWCVLDVDSTINWPYNTILPIGDSKQEAYDSGTLVRIRKGLQTNMRYGDNRVCEKQKGSCEKQRVQEVYRGFGQAEESDQRSRGDHQ